MGSDIESTSSAPETANKAEDLARIDPSSEVRDKTSSNASGSTAGGKAGWLLLGAAALLAAGSVGYNVYEGGAADSEPAAVDTAAQSMDALREAAENSTDDARPWSELAFAHYGRGEFAEAAEAYEQAIAIDGEEAVLWSAMGEALVMASRRDPMPPDALAAFEKALELDPSDPRARYFMAVKLDLEEDHEGAISAWLALLADTPAGAPWENDLIRTIQQVGAINDIDVADRLATVNSGRMPEIALPGSGAVAGPAASQTVRGPTQAQIDEASRMAPDDQKAMIEGMVAGLEARLQNEPNDLDGWVMLMRSHANLGAPGKAKAALNSAIAANPGEEEELRRQAGLLGIR